MRSFTIRKCGRWIVRMVGPGGDRDVSSRAASLSLSPTFAVQYFRSSVAQGSQAGPAATAESVLCEPLQRIMFMRISPVQVMYQ